MNILDLISIDDIVKKGIDLDEKTLMYMLIGGAAGCGLALLIKRLIEDKKSSNNVNEEMLNTLLLNLANINQKIDDKKG